MQQLVELFEPSIELVQPFRKTKRAVTDLCGIIARHSIKILNLRHILDVLLSAFDDASFQRGKAGNLASE